MREITEKEGIHKCLSELEKVEGCGTVSAGKERNVRFSPVLTSLTKVRWCMSPPYLKNGIRNDHKYERRDCGYGILPDRFDAAFTIDVL